MPAATLTDGGSVFGLEVTVNDLIARLDANADGAIAAVPLQQSPWRTLSVKKVLRCAMVLP